MVTPHSSGLEPHCPYYDGHLWVCKSWHTLCLKKKSDQASLREILRQMPSNNGFIGNGGCLVLPCGYD